MVGRTLQEAGLKASRTGGPQGRIVQSLLAPGEQDTDRWTQVLSPTVRIHSLYHAVADRALLLQMHLEGACFRERSCFQGAVCVSVLEPASGWLGEMVRCDSPPPHKLAYGLGLGGTF